VPYGINVCTPTGIHYSLNLRSGRLLRAWRSDKFGEISGMWVDRGGTQNLDPAGAASEFAEMAFLSVSDGEFYPDSLGSSDGFDYLGYELKKGEEPRFRYRLPDKKTEAFLCLKAKENGLLSDIKLKGATKKYWHAAASGKTIEATADGGFRINDDYYVFPATPGTESKIENRPGKDPVLLFLISENGLQYSTYW
jgi:hypothetical protein